MCCAGTLKAWEGLETLRTLQIQSGALAGGPLPSEWPADSFPQLESLVIQSSQLDTTLPASEPCDAS